MPSVYASWVGQAVVLQVATGDLRVPLRGTIVGESDSSVRIRVGDAWDIDIYKTDDSGRGAGQLGQYRYELGHLIGE